MNPLKLQVPTEPPTMEAAQELRIQLSALMDGEPVDNDQGASVWLSVRADDSARDQWHVHHLIGEVLRGELNGVPNTSAGWVSASASEFAAQVVRRAQASEAAAPEANRFSNAPLTLDVSNRPMTVSITDRVDPTERPAANDTVFRWKALAGVASLCATLVVAWNAGLGGWMAPEPLAARSPTRGETPMVAVADPAAGQDAVTPLWVQTGHGVMERDARLDALIQAHRQHGGATAWQIPTGFMRAASHESMGRP